MKEKLQKLSELQAQANLGGGTVRIEKQHAKGKLTARERVMLFLDPDSFEEIGQLVRHRSSDFGMEKTRFYGDGVITGYGTINNRLVYVFAQDFTVFGGSLSETQRASGVIPQISAIMGPCAGGAVYSPAMTDFTIMVEQTSYMFVTGPNVVKTVTNEEVSAEELGGAMTHASKSGVTHMTAQNDLDCINQLKQLLSYLPQNCESAPATLDYTIGEEYRPELANVIPPNANQPYDMRKVIKGIMDTDSFYEVHKSFAENIVVGFARIAGRSIGIVANQPASLAGVLDVDSSRKGARFVRFCDCFNIPLLVLVDVPGFLPGTDQEWNGIITNGAKLLYAFSEAVVPRVTLITRKAYGGAYDVMNSKHIGADMNFAWPSAEIAVMGAKGASEIIFKKEIKSAADPTEKLKEKEAEYAEKFAHPYLAAERGFIDEVIDPTESRRKLIKAFTMLKNKVDHLPRKKHGNIPL